MAQSIPISARAPRRKVIKEATLYWGREKKEKNQYLPICNRNRGVSLIWYTSLVYLVYKIDFEKVFDSSPSLKPQPRWKKMSNTKTRNKQQKEDDESFDLFIVALFSYLNHRKVRPHSDALLRIKILSAIIVEFMNSVAELCFGYLFSLFCLASLFALSDQQNFIEVGRKQLSIINDIKRLKFLENFETQRSDSMWRKRRESFDWFLRLHSCFLDVWGLLFLRRVYLDFSLFWFLGKSWSRNQ